MVDTRFEGDVAGAQADGAAREHLRAAISWLRRAIVVATRELRAANAFAVVRVRSAWSHRFVRVAAAALVALFLLPTGWLVRHVYFDRSHLPDLEPFVRFEPPTIGTPVMVPQAVLSAFP